MARTSAGAYALPEAPFVAGTVAKSARVNNNFADVATEMQDSLSRSGKGGMLADLAFGGHKGTGLSAGLVAGDALRFEQAPYTVRSLAIISSAAGGFLFSLPTDCVRFELDIVDVGPTAGAVPYLRWCVDGTGTNLLSGASDYESQVDSGGAAAASYASLGPAFGGGVKGRIHWSNFGSKFGGSSLVGLGTFSGAVTKTQAAFRTPSNLVAATHVFLGFVSTTVAGGRVTLLGATQ